jgi:hypothetical protein
VTTLLALDAGAHECAAAEFDRGVLRDILAFSARCSDGTFDFSASCNDPDAWGEVAIEIPQFDARVSKHVIDLAVHVCLIAGACRCPVYAYTPRQWIGSLQKPIHHHRIWEALTPAERALFPADTEARIAAACAKGGKDNWRKPGATYYGTGKGSEVHNLLDAAGLGLHHLGRYREAG